MTSKTIIFGACLASTAFVVAPATAQDKPSGEITVWGWNIAAEALEHIVPAFNEQYPDVKVTVQNMGHADLHDRALAGCAAGGVDLPDVVLVENSEAELYWQRFPECFSDMGELGYDDYKDKFPAFKQTELNYDGTAYAMPWDTGPVMVFYRRDLYEQAGIDPAAIETWDDFIAAGKKLDEATDGKVKMAAIEKGGNDDWFRMLAIQNDCFYYGDDGETVTVNQPGCVEALETVKKIWDAGILATGGWDQTIQFFKADAIASVVSGGWYEGTVRSSAPDQEGKWGVYNMPAFKEGGQRLSNSGGSSLAIPASSDNLDAAWAYVTFALGTPEGQIGMMKYRGLPVSLLPALDDPFIHEPQPYWGGQKVWEDMLSDIKDIPVYRSTPYYWDGRSVMIVAMNDYLDGKYDSAQAALDAVAEQISSATGLPIQE
ncbi:ABC transporter substrate-binding protein [Consotaella aegiceratis]|uniref:ABC transporter substrate-binding protein n=1 Tax=Consotaella aegiceratis TaxID=3097961 RepID=UPI002F401FA9